MHLSIVFYVTWLSSFSRDDDDDNRKHMRGGDGLGGGLVARQAVPLILGTVVCMVVLSRSFLVRNLLLPLLPGLRMASTPAATSPYSMVFVTAPNKDVAKTLAGKLGRHCCSPAWATGLCLYPFLPALQCPRSWRPA